MRKAARRSVREPSGNERTRRVGYKAAMNADRRIQQIYGGFVYWLGRLPFKQEKRDRYPYPLPSYAPVVKQDIAHGYEP